MPIPALLAKKTGRPVMHRVSRYEENYMGRARAGFQAQAKMGFRKDGRLVALDLYIVQDNGPYAIQSDMTSAGAVASLSYQPVNMRFRGGVGPHQHAAALRAARARRRSDHGDARAAARRRRREARASIASRCAASTRPTRRRSSTATRDRSPARWCARRSTRPRRWSTGTTSRSCRARRRAPRSPASASRCRATRRARSASTDSWCCGPTASSSSTPGSAIWAPIPSPTPRAPRRRCSISRGRRWS